MRKFYSFVLLISAFWPATNTRLLYAAPDAPSTERERLVPELANLVHLAHSAAPELRSLVLVQIAADPRIKSKELKEDLLEQAFEASRLAHAPFPVWAVLLSNTTSPPLPSRVVRTINANTGLDRLTLGTAAIKAMLLLNPLKAKELFDRLGAPKLQAFDCSEDLIPDTTEYFNTGLLIVNEAFSAEGERNFKPLEFAQLLVSSASSPAQATAAASLVAGLKASLKQRSDLVIQLAGQLGSMQQDSRAWSIRLDAFTETMSRLLEKSDKADQMILLPGWRAYLKQGISLQHCSEVASSEWEYPKWLHRAVQAFNERVAAVGALGVAPIAEEETRTSKTDMKADTAPPRTSARVQELYGEWRSIAFRPKKPADAADQAPVDWESRFMKYLDNIEKLSTADAAAGEDVILLKARMMGDAALIAPTGPSRESAGSRLLDLVRTANIPAQGVSAWYVAVNNWIRLSSEFGHSREKTLSAFETSNQSTLVLIAKLARLKERATAPKSQ